MIRSHNLPIFHSGRTATPPFLPFPSVTNDPEHGNIHYKNERTFLVDFTTWFGSSGSPVFIYDTSGFIDRAGVIHPLIQRTMLIGVVEGLVSMPVPGTITFNVVPNNTIQATQSVNIPANLGMCLSSSSILDFEPMLLTRGVKPGWQYLNRQENKSVRPPSPSSSAFLPRPFPPSHRPPCRSPSRPGQRGRAASGDRRGAAR